jgi:hypothetical protein
MRRLFRTSAVLIGGSAIAATLVVSPAAPAAPSARSGVRGFDTREVRLPAGTILRLRLRTAIGSDFSRPEDPVAATLAAPVRIAGRTVLPAGSAAHGYVTTAQRSGKVKGRARLGVRFSRIVSAGDHQTYDISTRSWVAVARTTKRKDAVKIGAPAAGGAIVGALAGGKKGAGIGALAGGGVGTAVVLSTRGREVRVGRGGIVSVRLAAPLTVRVRA